MKREFEGLYLLSNEFLRILDQRSIRFGGKILKENLGKQACTSDEY